VIQFLAGHGADVNAKNKAGFTPLALLMNPSTVAKAIVLTPVGSAAGSSGESPVDYTDRIAALLRKAGATR
jgi:hypothetical protein